MPLCSCQPLACRCVLHTQPRLTSSHAYHRYTPLLQLCRLNMSTGLKALTGTGQTSRPNKEAESVYTCVCPPPPPKRDLWFVSPHLSIDRSRSTTHVLCEALSALCAPLTPPSGRPWAAQRTPRCNRSNTHSEQHVNIPIYTHPPTHTLHVSMHAHSTCIHAQTHMHTHAHANLHAASWTHLTISPRRTPDVCATVFVRVCHVCATTFVPNQILHNTSPPSPHATTRSPTSCSANQMLSQDSAC